jgi:hypothetical protein
MRRYDSRDRAHWGLLFIFVRADRMTYIERIGIYQLPAIGQLVLVVILDKPRVSGQEPQTQQDESYEFTRHAGLFAQYQMVSSICFVLPGWHPELLPVPQRLTRLRKVARLSGIFRRLVWFARRIVGSVVYPASSSLDYSRRTQPRSKPLRSRAMGLYLEKACVCKR